MWNTPPPRRGMPTDTSKLAGRECWNTVNSRWCHCHIQCFVPHHWYPSHGNWRHQAWPSCIHWILWCLGKTAICVSVSQCYQSLTAHQHQKVHTVPKQVIMIATSIQSKHCTVWEHSLSGQVWTKCPTRPDTQAAPRGGCSHAPLDGNLPPNPISTCQSGPYHLMRVPSVYPHQRSTITLPVPLPSRPWQTLASSSA